jgi:hypothetical protein
MSRKVLTEKIKLRHLIAHETKRNVLFKFLLLLLILVLYFIFIAKKYGMQQGFLVTLLSWSFFVLCTPIADAGFLVDFPSRLIFRVKMLFSEMFVWTIAISLNLYAFFVKPEIYATTKFLSIFKHILETPWPFWSIILLSLVGTFVSIQFGDELLDKVKHQERSLYRQQWHNYKWLIMIFLFTVAFLLYRYLLKNLGINILI